MTKISQKSMARALVYIRCLQGLIKAQRNLVSSRQLADMTGFTDVQIRKDISAFGKVGTPRVGYNTHDLKSTLERFLLGDHIVKAVLFGVGSLGTALLRYPGFQKDSIQIAAAFEADPNKRGKVINRVRIYDAAEAETIIARKKASIGIMAVPGHAAQKTADVMVCCGLKGIVNFAPVPLSVPCAVQVKNIDFSIEFLSLYSEILRCRDCVIK